MPVEDHAVHDKVRIDAAKPYGCYNREMSEGYHAPNRFAGTTGNEPIWWIGRVRIPHVMSRECRYDMSLSDLRCNGCTHAGSGKIYAQTINKLSTTKEKK